MSRSVSSALVLSCVLVACGGGGGSNTPTSSTPANTPTTPSPTVDTANTADGLGDKGQTTGTVDLGSAAETGTLNAATPTVAVTLADDGKAMAAWGVGATNTNTQAVVWSSSSSGSTWSTPASLAQTAGLDPSYGITLRSNAAGSAVLGWAERFSISTPYRLRAARYVLNSGWQSNTYAFANGTQSGIYFAEQWDLALLDSNAFTASARIQNPANGDYTLAVTHTDLAGVVSRAVETSVDTELWYNDFSYFSGLPNGSGLHFYGRTLLPSGGVEIQAHLASAVTGGFAPFLIGTYSALGAPLVAAANSPSGRAALAVVENDPSVPAGGGNILHLVTVDTFPSIIVATQVVSASNTYISSRPVVAVDRDGNALAVWGETTGTLTNTLATSATVTLKWSRALAGQGWSTPQPLIPNLSALGTVPHGYNTRIALAMNASGTAVAAFTLNDTNNDSTNPSIAVGRFNFTTGWGDWTRVANKALLSAPRVAINASGQSVLTYWAWDTTRGNGKARMPVTGTTANVRAFALRF